MNASNTGTPAFQGLVDIGANLCDSSFDLDRNQVIDRARHAGLEWIVVTGSDLDSSRAAIALAECYPQLLRATVGIHPHNSASYHSSSSEEIIDLAGHSLVCALGETGLDFYRNLAPPRVQVAAFEAQLECAAQLQLPLFLHERDSCPRFLEILKVWRGRLDQVVVHCFTGSSATLRSYLDLDCHIGITGWITDRRRGAELRDLVALIPPQKLLVETDAPWLIPHNMPGQPAVKRRNEPAFLPWVVRAAAECTGVSERVLGEQTALNARKFFRI